MLGKMLKSFVTPPTFDSVAKAVIGHGLRGAPVLGLRELRIFRKRFGPNPEHSDYYLAGRIHLLDAILNVLNSGKLGVEQPLADARFALSQAPNDVRLELEVIGQLDDFLKGNDSAASSKHLISQNTPLGRWLLRFK